MPDWGSAGRDGGPAVGRASGYAQAALPAGADGGGVGVGRPGVAAASYGRVVYCGSERLALLAWRDDVTGSPAAPSLRVDRRGFFRFRWVFEAGPHAISAWCLQPANVAPRPSIVVRARPEIGIADDVEVAAPAGAGWVTVGPAAINPSVLGAAWVELRNNADSPGGWPVWFDHIQAS